MKSKPIAAKSGFRPMSCSSRPPVSASAPASRRLPCCSDMSATSATWLWPTCCWSSRRRALRSRPARARPARCMPTLRRALIASRCNKPGYGAKRVEVALAPGRPYQFRLLADGLLGYAWPKWVRAGERAEFRVHSVEPYKLDLWRYGLHKEHVAKIGWFDEHGPRATMQITPDGDYTQTGVRVEQGRLRQPAARPVRDRAGASGLYYFHARTDSGRFFSFPWIVAPAAPRAKIAVLASNITWNAYNNFGGRSNYIHADRLPPTPTVNARLELSRYNDPEFGTWNADDVCAAVVRPARADQSRARGNRKSPTRSRAAPPATSRRPSGGCWAGWSARASTTTSTPRPSCTPASSISTPTACWSSARIPNTGRAKCTRRSRPGSSSAAAGWCIWAATG